MLLEDCECKKCGKSRNRHNSTSDLEPKILPISTFSGTNHSSKSRKFSTRNPKKNKILSMVKLKGLGCKGISPVCIQEVTQTSVEWEAKQKRKKHPKVKKRQASRRNTNAVVQIPKVCCTPPGISIDSDVASRARNVAQRNNQREPSCMHRRPTNVVDASATNDQAIYSTTISRNNVDNARRFVLSHHPLREKSIEAIMFRQNLLSGTSIMDGHDQYEGLRLNVDDMSYEELLDLGERIGYVCTGLQEEEISRCLEKSKHSDSDLASLILSTEKNWKCSICQEEGTAKDGVRILTCGHYHHVGCIKQWLLQKNACPICKTTAHPTR